MKKKYQNGFFIFGIVVLIIMVTQLDFQQVWEGLQRAGYWFFAVIILWAFLYLFNTAAWYIIIRSGEEKAPAPKLLNPREMAVSRPPPSSSSGSTRSPSRDLHSTTPPPAD